MLKTLFDKYKWVAVAFIFLAYSVGVWNISTGYHANEYTKEKLALTQDVLKVTRENSELSQQLAKSLQETLEARREASTKTTKELIDEIAKDPRFKSCRTTDGVRSALQRKLDSQAR